MAPMEGIYNWDVDGAYLPMANIPYPNIGDLSY